MNAWLAPLLEPLLEYINRYHPSTLAAVAIAPSSAARASDLH